MYRKRVLVAAADPKRRTAIAEAARAAGYGALEAAAGMEAVERTGLDLPDGVVIDLDQGLDGWTTVKLLGESPRTEGIAVIVVGADSDGDRRKAALLGCRGCVPSGAPQAAVAELARVLGPADVEDLPETPTGVIRRRYWRRRPVTAA